MSKTAKIKKTLQDIIQETGEIAYMFSSRPRTAFKRSRKLPFEVLVTTVISLAGGSVAENLLNVFHCNPDSMPTASALNQRRDLLEYRVFEFLFQQLNEAVPCTEAKKDWRIIACDGTDINLPYNPDDKSTYTQSSPGQKGFNQLHLNALHDISDGRFIDAVVQPMHEENECAAMNVMVDRYKGPHKTIFVADRGYECYNLMAHVLERGMYFLIRGRDSASRSIASGLSDVPAEGSCDCWCHIELSKKQTKEAKARPAYKFVPNASTFDFLDLDTNLYYPMDIRVVRVKIPSGYEVLFTNLPTKEFPPEKLCQMYFGRWGIETHFRDLKYSCDLVRLHSRKMNFILQEIFAALLFHNYCVLIARGVKLRKSKAERKYDYRVNFALAVNVCRSLFLGDISPPKAEDCISRLVVPVRPNRMAPRHMATQSFVSFNYR